MTSAHALELTSTIIKNDVDLAVPLLKLLNGLSLAREDPKWEEAMRQVMLFLYSKTPHCEEAMRKFISQPAAPRAA